MSNLLYFLLGVVVGVFLMISGLALVHSTKNDAKFYSEEDEIHG